MPHVFTTISDVLELSTGQEIWDIISGNGGRSTSSSSSIYGNAVGGLDSFSASSSYHQNVVDAYQLDAYERHLSTVTVVWTPSPDLCEEGGSGIFLPLFGDEENLNWNKNLRQFLYTGGLLWCFLGVAIIADIFMGAIEKITSVKKTIKVKRDPTQSSSILQLNHLNNGHTNHVHHAEEGEHTAIYIKKSSDHEKKSLDYIVRDFSSESLEGTHIIEGGKTGKTHIKERNLNSSTLKEGMHNNAAHSSSEDAHSSSEDAHISSESGSDGNRSIIADQSNDIILMSDDKTLYDDKPLLIEGSHNAASVFSTCNSVSSTLDGRIEEFNEQDTKYTIQMFPDGINTDNIIADSSREGNHKAENGEKQTNSEKPTSKQLGFQKQRSTLSEDYKIITVKVWNDTVANLTLMALGSSAPEILLSCIELLDNNFFSGELGPSTIVGSAAFNLLCIVACCVFVIPAGEIRKIRDVSVYAVTSVTSVFAYVWLLIILAATSKDVVRPWEGIITFLMFPALVIVAYLADIGKILNSSSSGRQRLVSVQLEDMSKEEVAHAISKITSDHGNVTLGEDEMMRLLNAEHQPQKSRAAYRVAATRGATGGNKKHLKAFGAPGTRLNSHSISPEIHKKRVDIGFLECNAYAVLENAGHITAKVSRSCSEGKMEIDYKTADGPAKNGAKAGEDYIHVKGTLTFEPGEEEKFIEVKILDDESFEEDEDFYIILENPRCITQSIMDSINPPPETLANVVKQTSKQIFFGQTTSTNNGTRTNIDNTSTILQLTEPKCTITIIDDDLPGVISFFEEIVEMEEALHDEEFKFKVIRRNGSTGKVTVKYKTENDSAISPLDYDHVEGELVFECGQVDAYIHVNIKQRGRYEERERFRIYISDPTGGAKLDATTDGGEDQCIMTVEIVPGDIANAAANVVGKMMTLNRDKFEIGTANYKEQFYAALYVNGSPEEQAEATPFEWFMHILTIFWKVIFSIVPPTDYADGKLCFIGSLGLIGLLTAVVGDLAGLVGCVFSMPKSVTAITFVALGTSLPDLFASKKCAEEDPTADASVGNVTGSNSVNVFLGLGLPWMIGALYWDGATPEFLIEKNWATLCCKGDMDLMRKYANDPGFVVVAGSLGYSVAVFCACAVVCLSTLQIRRMKFGGELGGPNGPKIATTVFFVCLWFTYVTLSAIKAIDEEKK